MTPFDYSLPLKPQPIAAKHNSDTHGEDIDLAYDAVIHTMRSPLNVVCLDCGWKGVDSELLAQACPVCDGRCADV